MKDKFPGFKACIKMMHRGGGTFEDGFHWLLPRVDEYLDELIATFHNDKNANIKADLIELIGYSSSPQAFELLKEQLRSDNGWVRTFAIHGLKHFDTKEARQVLRDARYYELATPEATQELRSELQRIIGEEQPWEKYTRQFDVDENTR